MSAARPRGLCPHRQVLEDGLVVIAKRTEASPAVAFSLSLPVGSFRDPTGKAGTAYFLSRVIDRGTSRRSGEEIAELLDSAGVALAISVARHQFTLSCTCLAGDLASLLALAADIVRNPVLPEAEVETRRAEVLTLLQQDADHPATVAFEGLSERLYPDGHPYGRRLKGTRESVAGITRDDLAAFHAAQFGPRGATLVVVGDIGERETADQAARLFDGWKSAPSGAVGRDQPPPIVPRAERTARTIVLPGKAQSDVAYGFVTLRRDDPAYYDLSVMNNVLGQYGLGGRLADNIRERQGMAYYAFSSLDASLGEGPLVLRAGVDPANVERTVAAMDDEVRRMAVEGVSDKELSDSKRFLVGSIPRMLETNGNIASFLQSAEFHALGMDHDERLPDLIAAVTRTGASEAAKRFLEPSRATIVVAGPPSPDRP